MCRIIWFLLFTLSTICIAQNIHTRELIKKYKKTKVEYLVLSKKGEEKLKKPLFLFCQGSLSRPLQIISDDGKFPLLPFDIQIILKDYHLVLISKPGIPLEENVKNLNNDFTYPKDKLPPEEYILNNNLEYYYKRNISILNQLLKENWVERNKIVVAGHSEGSYVALEMANHSKKITHLIYSGGNPLGRMMSIINQDRMNKSEKEEWVPETLKFWKDILADKYTKELDRENTSLYLYGLSRNFTEDLLKLKIPVLVTYGTKDQNGIFNDYLNVEVIKNNKSNFTFKPYFNCDHNFFPVDENNNANYEVENWQKVGEDWMKWLIK